MADLRSKAPCVLALALLAFAAAKLLSGHARESWLPGWGHVSTALVEILLAALLLTRHRAWGLRGAVALFAVGGALAILHRGEPCGCLGNAVALDWRAHLAVAGACGLIAAWALGAHGRRAAVSGAG